MAAASVSLVEGAASTRFNRMVAVSKHLPSFLPFIISPAPSLYYNYPYSLLPSFPLDLEGNYPAFVSFPLSFSLPFITTLPIPPQPPQSQWVLQTIALLFLGGA